MVARGRRGGDPDPPGLLHLAERAPAARARPGARRAGRCAAGCAASSGSSRRSGSRRAGSRSSSSSTRRPGTGGRAGLQPRSTWLEIVKLEALAAKQVTRELRTHSIWSWGWATFSAAGIDQDKGEAALRLALGARSDALQRPGRRRAGDRRVADRRAARPAPAGRDLRAAGGPDPRPARSRRSRGRSATATSPRASCSSGSCSSRRSSWTRAPSSRPSSPSSTTTSAAASPRTSPRSGRIQLTRTAASGAAPRRVAARCRPRSLPRRRAGGGGDRRVPPHLRPASRRASSRPPGRSTGWAARPVGSRSRPSLRERIFALPRAGLVRTIHGRIRVKPLEDTVLLGTIPLAEARAGDRVVAQPLRPGLRLRELAGEGAGAGARASRLRRRRATVAGRADARRPVPVLSPTARCG